MRAARCWKILYGRFPETIIKTIDSHNKDYEKIDFTEITTAKNTSSNSQNLSGKENKSKEGSESRSLFVRPRLWRFQYIDSRDRTSYDGFY